MEVIGSETSSSDKDVTRIVGVGGRPAPPNALWVFKARDQSRTVAAVAEKLCPSRRENSKCKQCVHVAPPSGRKI